MADLKGFWDRLKGEVKTTSERTRRSADRAIKVGILKVDLVSLRRDRSRAHANLGERVLTLWNAGSLESMGSDAEVLRLRALVGSIQDAIASKEAEVVASQSAKPEPVPNS
jgi:hypothetical protein